MNDNKYLVFMGMFFVLCISIIGFIWYSTGRLQDLRDEYDMLADEQAGSVRLIETMQNKKLDLEEITGLNIDNAGSVSDAVEFYSYVRRAVENNNLELLSMNSDNNNDGILTLQLDGGYYSFAHLIADWRNMPFAVRINSLRLKRDNDSPTRRAGLSNRINAQVVLEAMTREWDFTHEGGITGHE